MQVLGPLEHLGLAKLLKALSLYCKFRRADLLPKLIDLSAYLKFPFVSGMMKLPNKYKRKRAMKKYAKDDGISDV